MKEKYVKTAFWILFILFVILAFISLTYSSSTYLIASLITGILALILLFIYPTDESINSKKEFFEGIVNNISEEKQ